MWGRDVREVTFNRSQKKKRGRLNGYMAEVCGSLREWQVQRSWGRNQRGVFEGQQGGQQRLQQELVGQTEARE